MTLVRHSQNASTYCEVVNWGEKCLSGPLLRDRSTKLLPARVSNEGTTGVLHKIAYLKLSLHRARYPVNFIKIR
jgi:hypothetical protein